MQHGAEARVSKKFRTLVEKVVERSEASEWSEAAKEWDITAQWEEPGGKCICGHHPIRHHNRIKNRETREELVVGSECIKHFGPELERIRQALQKLSKNPDRSGGQELYNSAYGTHGCLHDFFQGDDVGLKKELKFVSENVTRPPSKMSKAQLRWRLLIHRRLLRFMFSPDWQMPEKFRDTFTQQQQSYVYPPRCQPAAAPAPAPAPAPTPAPAPAPAPAAAPGSGSGGGSDGSGGSGSGAASAWARALGGDGPQESTPFDEPLDDGGGWSDGEGIGFDGGWADGGGSPPRPSEAAGSAEDPLVLDDSPPRTATAAAAPAAAPAAEWASEAASTAAASVATPASPIVSRVSAALTTPLGTCRPVVLLTPEQRQRIEDNRLAAERRKAADRQTDRQRNEQPGTQARSSISAEEVTPEQRRLIEQRRRIEQNRQEAEQKKRARPPEELAALKRRLDELPPFPAL